MTLTTSQADLKASMRARLTQLADHSNDVRINRSSTTPVRNDRDFATDKQIAFINKLRVERGLPALPDGTEIVRSAVTGILDDLKRTPRAQSAPVATAALEIGIYQVGERVYKVYPNQSKSHLLAKLLVVDNGEASWSYQGAAARFVKADQRMTLEQAKVFGAITGICCNCGRTLTDETSIEAGIGPICAQRFA